MKKEIDNIIKKKLNIDYADKEKIIDDPFKLAAIGIEIEEDLDIILDSSTFMRAKTIGDIQRLAKEVSNNGS